jgi:hypothetical protein
MAGYVLVAVGAVLLWFAYSASNAPVDQITTALTGQHTDRTMWYLILGVVAAAGGGCMALFGRRTA